jgi:hypothetical protein
MAVVSAPPEPLLSDSVSNSQCPDLERDVRARPPSFREETMRMQKVPRHDLLNRIMV